MGFFKLICGVMTGVLLAMKLKGLQHPLWMYLSVALGLFVLYYSVSRLQLVMDFLTGITEEIGLESGYFKILFKIVGIAYLCEFVSNVCRESGFLAVASQIEIGGRLTMMVLSTPILMAIVEMIASAL